MLIKFEEVIFGKIRNIEPHKNVHYFYLEICVWHHNDIDMCIASTPVSALHK